MINSTKKTSLYKYLKREPNDFSSEKERKGRREEKMERERYTKMMKLKKYFDWKFVKIDVNIAVWIRKKKTGIIELILKWEEDMVKGFNCRIKNISEKKKREYVQWNVVICTA